MKKILIFLILLNCSVFGLNLYPINDKNGAGYITKEGKVKIEQKYDFAFRFNGNYAIVIKNSKYGIIDKNNNVVLDFIYENLENLSDNIVTYKENGKYGFIDIKRKFKTTAVYDKIQKYQEGLIAVLIDDKWGFVDKYGKIKIEPKYFEVSNFKEGIAAFSYSKYKTDGFINKKGDIIVQFKDNNASVREITQGLYPYIESKDKSSSYVNKKGKIVLDKAKLYPIKSYCSGFYEGLSVFYIDDDPNFITTGYINKKGKIKYSLSFSIPKSVSEGEFSAFDNFNSNMAKITIDYKTGYINRKFKTQIPTIYEFARDFEGDLAYVKFQDKEGYINKKGTWIWQKEREGM